MKWNKPKQLIKRILVIVAFISLLTTIAGISIFYIWIYSPQIISNLDKSIPNYYELKISELHTRAKTANTIENKFLYYTKIAEELETITSIHKFYVLKNKANNFIIDYLIKKERIKNAFEIANNWQKHYPYDFTAKYKYIELLIKYEPEEALIYYKNLYEKHKNINKLNSDYIDFLIKLGKFEKALDIALNEKNNFNDNSKVRFMFYFIDNKHKIFSKNSKVPIKNYINKNGFYTVKLDKKFTNLNGLRLDLDNIAIGSTIMENSLTIKSRAGLYENITIKHVNHIDKQSDGFIITGNDPFIVYELSNDISKITEKIKIEAKLLIKKKVKRLIDKITNPNDWQIYLSNTKIFETISSKMLLVKTKGKLLLANTNIHQKTYKFIKIELPKIKNFAFYDLNIFINNIIRIPKQNILKFHDIEQTERANFLVTGDNPYIIIDTNMDTLINDISLNINLGNK